MTHLTRDELAVWRDRKPAEDRERVTSHLASCGRCAAVYAELIRTAPAGSPVHFKAADFVERGYAARRAASAPGWSGAFASWKTWSAISAAAAIVFAVTLSTSVRRDDSAEVRGSRIELAAPAAVVGRPIALQWASGIAAPAYDVEVKDSSGAVVFRKVTKTASVTLPPDVSARLHAGDAYSWTVTGLDADGQAITSASGAFSPTAPR